MYMATQMVLHWCGTDKEKTCELPDGNIITVGAKRFHCGEEASGSHDTSFRRYTMCDVDVRKNLYANVLSSGGTAMFQVTGERTNRAEVLFQPNVNDKGARGIHCIFFR